MSEAPSTTPPTKTVEADESELRGALQSYSDAFLSGDGQAAYDLFSERCKNRADHGQFIAMVDLAKQQYGESLACASYSEGASGDLARVSCTHADSSIDQDSEPWTREDGQWHQDDC
ncbi:hypothetical protein [Nocardioides jensenii]|uniref:hypothetical protein n=1 Tax=Nocardioides jensenii TaxID=1843 RepID=UPI000837938D|nr:hypothetical protein [Nocardioides jensenii]